MSVGIQETRFEHEKVAEAVSEYSNEPLLWLNVLALCGEHHNITTTLNGTRKQHNKQKLNLLNLGRPGGGKSHNTIDFVDFLSFLNPSIKLFAKRADGHYSIKAFMAFLSENSYATVYVDEGRLLLGNPVIVDLLKQALFNGSIISWKTTKDECNLEAVKFVGNICFNANRAFDTASDLALMDRCFVSQVKPNNQEIVNSISKSYKQNITEEIWKKIADRIMSLRLTPEAVELSEEETTLIFEHWKTKLLQQDDKGETSEASYRSYEKTVQLFGRTKLFFGYLDETLIRQTKELADQYSFIENTRKSEVKDIVKKYGVIARQELAKELAETKGITERQAQNIIKKAIENGEVKSPNRTTVIV